MIAPIRFSRGICRPADQFAELCMLAAIARAFAAEGYDGDAIGPGAGGNETRYRAANSRFVKRAYAAFGSDLNRFHHGFVRKSWLNREYHIDGVERRRWRCHGGTGPIADGKGVAATHRRKPYDFVPAAGERNLY